MKQPALARPSRLLKQVNACYGSPLWDRVNKVIRMKLSGKTEWPDWCFIPMGAWNAIIFADGAITTLEQTLEVAKVAAVGAWRYTQGIYRFDETLYEAIAETELAGDLPSDVLFRLPEYCVYVELPEQAGSIKGFFAHLEYCKKNERAELRFYIDQASSTWPFVLHIGDWSIEEAIWRACNAAIEQFSDASRQEQAKKLIEEHIASTVRMFSMFTNLLLYLASDEPDIEHVAMEMPKRPAPRKTKNGLELEPPTKPRVWNVGTTVGKAINKWKKEPTGKEGSSPMPHVRKAHWHGFWRGSRNGERNFFYKWLPPILVNVV